MRVVSVFVFLALLLVIAPNADSFITMQDRAKNASTKSNCHTVQLAAEDFAAQNDGTYPYSVDRDTTSAGDSLVDMLPGGERLENPFTEERTEPRNGEKAGAGPVDGTEDTLADADTTATEIVEGAVVYQCVTSSSGTAIGYIITGYGKDGELILSLTSGE